MTRALLDVTVYLVVMHVRGTVHPVRIVTHVCPVRMVGMGGRRVVSNVQLSVFPVLVSCTVSNATLDGMVAVVKVAVLSVAGKVHAIKQTVHAKNPNVRQATIIDTATPVVLKTVEVMDLATLVRESAAHALVVRTETRVTLTVPSVALVVGTQHIVQHAREDFMDLHVTNSVQTVAETVHAAWKMAFANLCRVKPDFMGQNVI